jgi:hypothetical protein
MKTRPALSTPNSVVGGVRPAPKSITPKGVMDAPFSTAAALPHSTAASHALDPDL